MGRTIDRIVFTSIAAFGLFALYMDAFGIIPVAAVMTFVSMACLKKLAGLIPENPIRKIRRRRAAARERLLQISLKNSAEAHGEILSILESAYPAAMKGAVLSVVLHYPGSTALSPDDVLKAWKSHRSADRLIVATPARVGNEAVAISETLKAPVVRILDEDALASLICRMTPAADQTSAHENQASARSKRTLHSRFDSLRRTAAKARPVKCLMYAAFMYLLFFITGSAVYLVSGAILTFIPAAAVRLRSAPESLFPD